MSQVDMSTDTGFKYMTSFTGPVPRALAALSSAIIATSIALAGNEHQPLKTIAHVTVYAHHHLPNSHR